MRLWHRRGRFPQGLPATPGLVRKGRKVSLSWGPHGATGSCNPSYEVPEGGTQQMCTQGSVKGKQAIKGLTSPQRWAARQQSP